MISYNHEKYIAQAIESVLIQKVAFDYELVIGEDCSTDNTRALVLEYQRCHPNTIRLLLPKTNLGMMENTLRTFEACQGEFVALLEGDDYWGSVCKLQRQVDFLNAHPECSMVFSSAFLDRGKESEIQRPIISKNVFKLEDLFTDNFIPTCSVLYRNLYRGKLPSWIKDAPFGDWPLHVLHALHGDIGYIDEPLAVYRVHSGGVWTSKPGLAKFQETLAIAKLFSENLPMSISRESLWCLERDQRKAIVYRCLVWGNEPQHGRREVWCLFRSGCWPFDTIKDFLRFLVWFFCPFLGNFFRRISLMLKR
jgi:glycosyltransferase involved in cell wall biosynthesis